ncbi:hypothetical protein [Enterococcus caccae]|uniref:Ethanolamine utilization protein EutQ n=1 Tax=Enterococcus caccae ATCC BAA-1240 TaxID=1158612 RepID=R3TQR0_9ENTE|nr:hypothetical protein [Enterococcus caccae]EOL43423.1 hypothetical protein UC7_02752 [Enterococcus caccae ATCC BAA-1240]EOT68177.1 hypothetical protein I580_00560 [Enterococcus caccae ATCC BAA-1240]OJG26959.1 hypothetical protein RU98_GL003050 [Enterococcus caccae]
MKKLICAKDIETLHSNGDQVILIDKQTIITPSAKDLADEYQMTFKNKVSENLKSLDGTQEITKEDLVNMLKKLLNEAGITGFEDSPFEYQKHKNGLKIIRGSTVKLSPISATNENVCYQEILTSEESNLHLGILEINNSHFCEEDTLESINHVISGELSLTIDKTTFKASKGDIIFVPRHSAIHWSTPNKVTILSGKLKQGG